VAHTAAIGIPIIGVERTRQVREQVARLCGRDLVLDREAGAPTRRVLARQQALERLRQLLAQGSELRRDDPRRDAPA